MEAIRIIYMKKLAKKLVVSLFRFCGFVPVYELRASQLETQKRQTLLSHGEVPRAAWHLQENLKTMRGGTKKIKELVEFCCPKLKGELNVSYPPKHIKGVDICVNLPAVFEPSEIYPNVESFIKTLDIFVPNDKMEVVGKFLNITYPRDLISYNIGRIVLWGD